jgi:mono/diheme cytochrome c family protein
MSMGQLRELAFLASLLVVGCTRSEASDAINGRDLFTATCARCHGTGGSGGLAMWEGGPSPTDFRSHEFQSRRTNVELARAIKLGKPPGMPAFGGTFNDDQIAALVSYVRGLDPQRVK